MEASGVKQQLQSYGMKVGIESEKAVASAVSDALENIKQVVAASSPVAASQGKNLDIKA